MVKCSHADCARDGSKHFRGTGKVGRPRAGAPDGIPYCPAHYEQLRRGGVTRALRHRGEAPCSISGLRATTRAQTVEDCATIADFHGHKDLAILLRRLRC